MTTRYVSSLAIDLETSSPSSSVGRERELALIRNQCAAVNVSMPRTPALTFDDPDWAYPASLNLLYYEKFLRRNQKLLESTHFALVCCDLPLVCGCCGETVRNHIQHLAQRRRCRAAQKREDLSNYLRIIFQLAVW